jgi:ATP synthase F1 gamma subunit
LKRLQEGRYFGVNAVDMIFKSDQFMQRKMPAEIVDPMTVVVPISSDKGLCGAVNSTVVREVKKMLKNQNRSKFAIFAIGNKGSSGLVRAFPDILKTSISAIGTPYNYPTIMSMAVNIQNMSKDADKIIIVYNEF